MIRLTNAGDVSVRLEPHVDGEDMHFEAVVTPYMPRAVTYAALGFALLVGLWLMKGEQTMAHWLVSSWAFFVGYIAVVLVLLVFGVGGTRRESWRIDRERIFYWSRRGILRDDIVARQADLTDVEVVGFGVDRQNRLTPVGGVLNFAAVGYGVRLRFAERQTLSIPVGSREEAETVKMRLKGYANKAS